MMLLQCLGLQWSGGGGTPGDQSGTWLCPFIKAQSSGDYNKAWGEGASKGSDTSFLGKVESWEPFCHFKNLFFNEKLSSTSTDYCQWTWQEWLPCAGKGGRVRVVSEAERKEKKNFILFIISSWSVFLKQLRFLSEIQKSYLGNLPAFFFSYFFFFFCSWDQQILSKGFG